MYLFAYTILEEIPGFIDKDALSGDLSNYITGLIELSIIFAAIAAVLVIMFSGVSYMLSEAVPVKEDLKSRIGSALFGLILALSAWLILATINPKIIDTSADLSNVAVIDSNNSQSGGGGAAGGNPNEANLPEAKAGQEVILRNTNYYVSKEEDYEGELVPLKDSNGNTIAMVRSGFYESLKIEGTGKLLDGTVVNTTGEAGKYMIVGDGAPYGLGAESQPLVPFRSVAVDPKVIKIGSVLHVKQLEGLTLPDGTIHDGKVLAVDTGGAIKNDRIDIFIGDRDYQSLLKNHGINNMDGLNVTVERVGWDGDTDTQPNVPVDNGGDESPDGGQGAPVFDDTRT